ncbi:MAG: squalene/phytoene synthase family protein [Alphaproteobacteria bacterium]|nr:squalene/phytoene synthase family protein [Alphaproteobacteria bacterium]
MEPSDSARYCLDQLREHDHDRYLAALFLPAESRGHAVAIQAFNLEIARTREIVSEPLLGQIRLQWWRETVEGIYAGTPREHPVVAALRDACEAREIAREDLFALIDAREDDLDDAPPRDLAALEEYAEKTSGRLTSLVMSIVGGGADTARAAALDVGAAWSLVGLARSVAFHARSQRLYIPEELLTAYEVERRRLFDLKPSEALNGAVRRMVERGEERLARARALQADLSRAERRALLLATLADRHIARMRAAGFDPFAFREEPAPAALRLLWASMRGRY